MAVRFMVVLLDKKDKKIKKPWPWPGNYTLKLEDFIVGIINKESAVAYSGGESTTFSNGLIMKMGPTASVSTGDTISFAATYPNATKTVVASPNIASAVSFAVSGLTSSGFDVHFSGGGAKTIQWIAIGH